MTDVYLLWEWTEEREAKVHHGIFSSEKNAQAAAQIDADQHRRGYFKVGDPRREPVPLDWSDPAWGGAAQSDYREGDDGMYEISRFTLDMFEADEVVPGEPWESRRVQL